MSNNNVKVKKALTVTMALALAVTLSSCSGATNTYGNLDRDAIYAEAGGYKVTNGELWDELKWNVQDVLTNQKTNAVLYKQIDKITLVVDKEYAQLTDDEKTTLGVTSEAEFTKLKEKYTTRLMDYVVQDVYNQSFSIESYWEGLESLADSTIRTVYDKYRDEIFSTYQKTALADGTTYYDIVKNATEEDHAKLLDVAKDLRELYFPLYAKELLAYDAVKEDVEEAAKDDDGSDADKTGYFQNTTYTNKFKSKYTNTYDLNMVLIRFSTDDEFNSTLRAFGVKLYNKEYYFLRDNDYEDADYETYINSADKMSMSKYIKRYDDFSSSQLNNHSEGAYKLSSEEVFELYLQIYNYMYSGYRPKLPTSVDATGLEDDLNKLRDITYRITVAYSSGAVEKYDASVAKLLQDNHDEVTYSSKELSKISDTFKTYAYETLKLKDDKDLDNPYTRYSTATQSANSAYYVAYKFGDELDEITDEKLKSYEEFYNSSLSTYDILNYIKKDENKELFNDIVDALILDEITDSKITNVVDEKLKDVNIKIYNESVEIGYKAKNSDYSSTIGGAKNGNILATISYDNKTWDLNIVADANDKDSVMIPGTTTAYGVFDDLEKTSGANTAINLISRKVIKNTEAYKKALQDNEARKNYKTVIENILIYFSNDYYSSSGYPSSIGKYNFLQLYFHTANIDQIVDDTYVVSKASSELLTNYSNSNLAEFFKLYTDLAYEKYFSLDGTRFLVYMDRDEDDEADTDSWKDEVVEFRGNQVTRGDVARTLVSEVFDLVQSSTSSHTDVLSNLVTEINESARAVYEENPIVAENKWAEYRKLGFKVKNVEFSVTNSTTDQDYNLKQRLYDYTRGESEDGKTYQYYINDTTPTLYIESNPAENAVITEDGVNLIVVSSGTAKASAKWSEDDFGSVDILKDVKIKYNDSWYTINNIFNETDSLNLEQIKLYILDYAVNGSSTMMPSSISTAITNYLAPVYTRFTSDETQRIILLNFINKQTGNKVTSDNLYDVVKFANTSYNGAEGTFAKIIVINQNVADSYASLNGDTTGTSDTFKDWWTKLYENIDTFSQDGKENK